MTINYKILVNSIILLFRIIMDYLLLTIVHIYQLNSLSLTIILLLVLLLITTQIIIITPLTKIPNKNIRKQAIIMFLHNFILKFRGAQKILHFYLLFKQVLKRSNSLKIMKWDLLMRSHRNHQFLEMELKDFLSNHSFKF